MLSFDPGTATRFHTLRGLVRDASPDRAGDILRSFSTDVRLDVLTMIEQAGLGHVGGDLSVTDIMVTLYGAVLDVDPRRPLAPDRDRFVLSKGHCAASLYATLARCGFFPAAETATFARAGSALGGHPDRRKVPGVEANTGPLGHGLPIGVGCALAARLSGRSWRTFVVLGDGELQEGSNWEAAMAAAHHRLGDLYAIVDRNGLQQGDRTEDTVALEPLAARWTAFGWEVREVDGHDHAALLRAFAPATADRPVAVVAHTRKGKGVSFMEDRAEWHHKVPDRGQVRAAVAELTR